MLIRLGLCSSTILTLSGCAISPPAGHEQSVTSSPLTIVAAQTPTKPATSFWARMAVIPTRGRRSQLRASIRPARKGFSSTMLN